MKRNSDAGSDFDWNGNFKCYVAIVFGLIVIWTGLLRSIEAQTFKPNAFFFCMTMGLAAIGAGFAYRTGRVSLATVLIVLTAGITLAFYLSCWIKQPEQDATLRVGLAIIASIAALSLTLLPRPQKN